MSTPSIANVVVHVTDLDRALGFYRDGLGLAVRFDSGWGSPLAMLELSGTPAGTPMRVVGFELGGTAGLTLCSFQTRESPMAAFEAGGQAHVGFVVENLDAVLARLVEHGGVPIGVPGVVGPGERRSRLAFLRDPDGTFVELVEHLPVPVEGEF